MKANADKQSDIARTIVGTRLVGAQGRTRADQRKIGATVARLCAAKVWRTSECARHDKQSRETLQAAGQFVAGLGE